VEIDTTGWRVIDHPPVRFRRASGMKPMPIPVKGGSVETLRSFLNVQSDTDFVLVIAWALACRGAGLERAAMSAAEALKAARAVGIRVGVDGDELVREACAHRALIVRRGES
jgi:hypothetical protein